MIEIDGKLVNVEHIVSAEVATRHYMNGSTSRLIVKLADGSRIEREHGYGFNAWETLDKIRARPHHTGGGR